MAASYFAEPFGNLNHCAVETAYRIAEDGRMKERLLMVLLSPEGRHAPEIAEIVHRTPETVLRWLHKRNKSGFGGLDDRPYSGRPPVLTPEEQAVTVKRVKEQSESGRRLSCRQISIHIFENIEKKVDHDTVRRMLHRHSGSWQKPAKKDHRADPELQGIFRKTLEKRMKKEKLTRFFFEDEVIFSLTTAAACTWGEKGKRTVIRANLSREKIINIGAVEPLTGENFHIFVPETTKNAYEAFLTEFAKKFPDDRIVLIHDGAPWHNAASPDDRIEFLKLPPYSPQLNPIERLWHRIKNNFVHNRFFNNIDELDHALTECLKNETVLKNAIRSVCTVT